MGQSASAPSYDAYKRCVAATNAALAAAPDSTTPVHVKCDLIVKTTDANAFFGPRVGFTSELTSQQQAQIINELRQAGHAGFVHSATPKSWHLAFWPHLIRHMHQPMTNECQKPDIGPAIQPTFNDMGSNWKMDFWYMRSNATISTERWRAPSTKIMTTLQTAIAADTGSSFASASKSVAPAVAIPRPVSSG